MGTPTSPSLDQIRSWPATVSISDAAKALGISRSAMYEMARTGTAPVRILSFGQTRRVVTSSIIELLA